MLQQFCIRRRNKNLTKKENSKRKKGKKERKRERENNKFEMSKVNPPYLYAYVYEPRDFLQNRSNELWLRPRVWLFVLKREKLSLVDPLCI